MTGGLFLVPPGGVGGDHDGLLGGGRGVDPVQLLVMVDGVVGGHPVLG